MRLTSPGRSLSLALAALLVTGTPAPGAFADPERPVDRVSVLPAERAGAQRCPALAPARRPLRVMFVGDSMTQGLSGSATYRYWVWRGLQATGVDAEFVGPRRRTHRAPRDEPARASYEHVDHGFAGQLAHAAEAGATFLTHPDRPRQLARRYDPDVVVLQLGYNDANRADGEEIARRTAAFVRSVRRVDEARGGPRTRFVLGQIPRSARSDTIPLAERTAITREANRLVAERLAEPCLVAVNDLDSRTPPRWRPGRDTFDGRHPNPVGETLLAQRMLDALRRLGVMRQQADVFDPAEAWEPDLTLTGERVGGRQWLLDWADAERLAAADRARLRLAVPGRAPRLTPWTAGTSVVMGLAPGTEVSLVLRRGDAPGRMVAGPGPAFVVPERAARRE